MIGRIKTQFQGIKVHLPRTLALAMEVEHRATVYSRKPAIGEAEVLTDFEMGRVLEKFIRWYTGFLRSL